MKVHICPSGARVVLATALVCALAAPLTQAQAQAQTDGQPYQVQLQARVVFGTDGRAKTVDVLDANAQPAAFIAQVRDRLARARIQPPVEAGQPAQLGTGVSLVLDVTPGPQGGQVRIADLVMHPLLLAMRLVAMPDDAFISGETEREVQLQCDVDVQGRCAQATVQTVPGMPESVRRWARLTTEDWRFEPQTLNGQPIPGSYQTRLKVLKGPDTQPEDFRVPKFERITNSR